MKCCPQGTNNKYVNYMPEGYYYCYCTSYEGQIQSLVITTGTSDVNHIHPSQEVCHYY